MKFGLCVLFYFWTTGLFAGELPDFNNREALHWAIRDNPRAWVDKAREELNKIKVEIEPKRWVRAFWFVSELSPAWDSIEHMQNELGNAAAIAAREQMYEDQIGLLHLLARKADKHEMKITEQNKADFIKGLFDSVLQLAKQRHLPRLEARILADYAEYINDLGDVSKSLEMLVGANKIIDTDQPSIDKLLIKTVTANIITSNGQKEKGLAIYLELDQQCQAMTLRSVCQVNYYNLGKYYVDQIDLESVRKAGPYFEKTVKIGEDIDEKWTIGVAHSGLITYYRKLKDYQKSYDHVLMAIKIFGEQQVVIWLADSYMKGAEVLIELQRFKEALQYIEKSRENFPADFRRDVLNLEHLSYKAYKALGNHEKALQHMEKFTALMTEMSKDKEKSDYSKIRVQMGLQIEEEKNKTLQKDNEIKSLELNAKERLRIVLVIILALAGSVIVLMLLGMRRSQQIKLSKIKMQRILDNIDEGILTLNTKLQVEEEYSLYLPKLLQIDGNLEGTHAQQFLFRHAALTVEEQSIILESLQASMGEGELQWQFNEAHLPLEIAYRFDTGIKYVSVHWSPIFDANDQLQRVLLSLRDETEQKNLREQVEQEKSRSDRIAEKIKELSQADASRTEDLLMQVVGTLESLGAVTSGDQLKPILRQLHTTKGIARSLKIRGLSGEIHLAEDILQNRANQDPSHLKSLLHGLYSTVEEYQFVMTNIMRRSSDGPLRIRNLMEFINRLLPQLLEHMQQSDFELKGIEVIDEVVQWPESISSVVEQILVHALTNSVDHGFVLPRSRGMQSQVPYFHVIGKQLNGVLELTIQDNGAGLDMERLRAKAKSIGFVPKNNDSIADVVFVDGISTADGATATSGRGIGLAAIRGLCEEHGGHVRIAPVAIGSGTQLMVQLPLANEMNRKLA